MAALAPQTFAKVAVRAGVPKVAVKPMAVAAPRASVRSARKAAPATRSLTVAKFSPVEVAQIAGEADFIAGVAGTMWAITLVGLAIGFVLLRVESLVEEGKL